MGEFRREVLPPRPSPGLGLTAPLMVLLGTLFVTMAMAAMALVPRPPAGRQVRTRIAPRPVAPVPRAAAAPMAAPDLERCRAPIHRADPDGTVATTFALCAGPRGSAR